MLTLSKSLCSLLVVTATLVAPAAFAQSSNTGTAPTTQSTSQPAQKKPLRPRKRLRQALMNKMKARKKAAGAAAPSSTAPKQ